MFHEHDRESEEEAVVAQTYGNHDAVGLFNFKFHCYLSLICFVVVVVVVV